VARQVVQAVQVVVEMAVHQTIKAQAQTLLAMVAVVAVLVLVVVLQENRAIKELFILVCLQLVIQVHKLTEQFLLLAVQLQFIGQDQGAIQHELLGKSS